MPTAPGARQIAECICLWVAVLCAAMLPIAAVWAEAAPRIVFPRAESDADSRSRYPLAVLQLALEHSDVRYVLQPSSVPMQQARSLLMLERGQIDVAWSMVTAEVERRVRVIPIPIDRGLLGWRLLLVRQGEAARFTDVRDVSALSTFSAGLGHDWPDADVLRANGLPVAQSASYEGLFVMLTRGRFDYFPRSLVEVFGELDARSALGIEIEPSLLLRYRAALYLLVGRDQHALAERIERGLRESIADGRFSALFSAEFGAVLTRANLSQRRIVDLHSGWPSDEVAATQPELWFTESQLP